MSTAVMVDVGEGTVRNLSNVPDDFSAKLYPTTDFLFITDGVGFARLKMEPAPVSTAIGSGTVTDFSVTGLAPLFTASVATSTTTPALSFSLTPQSANLVFAGPASGSAAAPTFRSLVPLDIPDIAESQVTGLVADLALLAPLASPALTGVPTAPTAAALDDSTTIATTAWVKLQGYGIAGGGGVGTVTSFSSGNLSPLFTTSVANATTTPALSFALSTQSAHFALIGPTTGAAAAPTFRALIATDIPAIAESGVTNLVSDLASKAPLASPAFTGTPTSVTPITADNSTKIATTAYVQAQGYTSNVGTVTSVSGTAARISSTGGAAPVLDLIVTAVTPAAYGSASAVGTFTVDAYGRLTLAASTTIAIAESQVTSLVADLALKAPLASPTFTGVPLAPTPLTADNSTKIATTAFVKAQGYLTTVGGILSLSAGGTNADLSAAVSGALFYLSAGAFAATPALTGILQANGAGAPTAGNITESQVTNLVADLALKAPLASPTFTGTPAAPTALTADNSTTIATTAFVKAQGYTTNVGTVTSVSGTATRISSTGGAAPVLDLIATAVTAAAYGSASSVGTFTVDAFGRLTAAANATIAIAESQVTNLVSDLAAKQPLDTTLTAFAAYNTNGLLTQTTADTFVGRTIVGTALRLAVTNGSGAAGNPTLDIDAAYVGQASITTLGTVTTGTWSATAILETKGGTNQTTYILGDTLYSSAANTLAKLAGNITATRKFLRQTGTGAVSAAPAWDVLLAADIPNIAESQVTNLVADLALKAPLASPALTGVPTAPTPLTADNSTTIATTAFVKAQGYTSNVGTVTSVSGTAARISSTGGAAPVLDLIATAVTAAAYGSASAVGTFTVDAFGRLTLAATTSIAIAESQVTNLVADLALKAPLASPTFTGTPTAPTPLTADNTTKLATTAYVQAQGYTSNLGTVTSVSGTAARISSTGGVTPVLDLIATAVTAAAYGSASAVGTFTVDAFGRLTLAATTSIAIAESQVTNLVSDLALKAPLASPALTGVPTAPTAAVLDDSTTIATTAWVKLQGYGIGGGGGSGTVTSFSSGNLAPIFTTSVANATTTPALSFTLSTQTAHFVLVGPAGGAATTPTFRLLVASDIPALPESGVTNLVADLALLAPLASPNLTGNPLAPTQLTADNTTKIATTAFVKAQGYTTNVGTVTSVSGTAARISSTGGATPVLDLIATAVTAAAYGSTSAVATFTVDAFGRLTLAASTTIAIAESQVTSLVSDLAARQPLDSTLTAFSGYNTNGLITQTALDTFTGRTIVGTTNRLAVTNGSGVAGNPTMDIDAAYVGQASITTLGTVVTGTWSATAIGEGKGGTNQTTYTLGDTLYSSAANTLAKLAGNTTATRKFLRQTGTGAVSAAPAWDVLLAADIPNITESQVTNLVADLALKAPLASPALTGVPTAPTAATLDDSTTIATTAWVKLQGYGVAGPGGSVTSFSSGNLSPLFTTSVANATTTPALSFALSTQSAHFALIGPTTGAAAAPTFRALIATDIPAIAESGVTNLVTDLAAKQPLDATLTSLAAFNANGVMVQVVADTFTAVVGTNGRLARWTTASPYLASSAIQDDGTTVGIGSAPNAAVALVVSGKGSFSFAPSTTLYGMDIVATGNLASARLFRVSSPGAPFLFTIEQDVASNYVFSMLGGGLNVGGSTAITAGVTSATVGFRVNGAATTGHVLRGNGTNFVDAALIAADIPAIAESGVTNLVADLAAKQTLDATLTALAAYNTNGLITQTAADTFTGRTIVGTTNRLAVTNGSGVAGNPTLDIDAAYVGQASITTLGTVVTGTWSATAIGEGKGGTNQTTYTLGDTLYSSAANTLAKLAGNTTATRKFLRQTGTGAVSAAPAWDVLLAADIPSIAESQVTSLVADLAALQPLDSTLTALAAFNTNGVMVQSAANTFTAVTGTNGRLARWTTAAPYLASSATQDDGSTVGIGTAPSATFALSVSGKGSFTFAPTTSNYGLDVVASSSLASARLFRVSTPTAPFLFTIEQDVASNCSICVSGGNVAIGLTSPLAPLHVRGTASVVSTVFNSVAVATFDTLAGSQLTLNLDDSNSPFTASLQHKDTANGATYPLALNPLGGNIGIGKTNPATALDVNGVINAVTGFRVNGAATNGNVLMGNGTNFVSTALTSATGANPTALVGLTAVNGAASTFLRSDGAPAIDQNIAPIWANLHTFKITDAVTTAVTTAAVIAHNSSGTPGIGFGTQISFKLESTTTVDRAAAELNVAWTTATDASRASKMGFSVVLSAGAPTEYMSLSPFLLTVTGTVNVSSGYQLGGTAANGNFLRGNGTSFVSAALVAADIPSLDTSKITTGVLSTARGGTAVDFSSFPAGLVFNAVSQLSSFAFPGVKAVLTGFSGGANWTTATVGNLHFDGTNFSWI